MEKLVQRVREIWQQTNGQWRKVLLSAMITDVVIVLLVRRVLGWGKKQQQQLKVPGTPKRIRSAQGKYTDGEVEGDLNGLDNDNQIHLDISGNGPLLICADLDGTLLTDQHDVTQRTINTLRRFSNRGGTVVLATGQPIRTARLVCEKLALNNEAYLIVSGGSQVYRSTTNELIMNRVVSAAAAERLTGGIMARIPGFRMAVECGKVWYATHEEFFDLLERYLPGVGQKLKKIAKIADDGDLATLFGESMETSCSRVLGIHPDMDSDKVLEMARDVMKEENMIYNSGLECQNPGVPGAIEILPANTHKGSALKFICESLLHVPQSRVVAFGNEMNDKTMLEYAGKGIAVQNAPNTLKEHCDLVSSFTNNEDAVAIEVENLLMECNDLVLMRDNISRLHKQLANQALSYAALEAENESLQDALEKHEEFVHFLQTKSPSKFQSPARRKSIKKFLG